MSDMLFAEKGQNPQVRAVTKNIWFETLQQVLTALASWIQICQDIFYCFATNPNKLD